MSRVYNFSAGPAVLPEEVLKEAAAEMLDYNGTGMSVMEMSHRSKAFEEIITAAEQDLRDLMNIPDNYKVLFLQGGADRPCGFCRLFGTDQYFSAGNRFHRHGGSIHRLYQPD